MVLLQGNGGDTLVVAEVDARFFFVCGLGLALEVAGCSARSFAVPLDEFGACSWLLGDICPWLVVWVNQPLLLKWLIVLLRHRVRYLMSYGGILLFLLWHRLHLGLCCRLGGLLGSCGSGTHGYVLQLVLSELGYVLQLLLMLPLLGCLQELW